MRIPYAQLVDLSQAQDIAAGDGTTSVVVIAGALLSAAEKLLAKGSSCRYFIPGTCYNESKQAFTQPSFPNPSLAQAEKQSNTLKAFRRLSIFLTATLSCAPLLPHSTPRLSLNTLQSSLPSPYKPYLGSSHPRRRTSTCVISGS